MIKFSQITVLVLLLAACWGISANEVWRNDPAGTRYIHKSRNAQELELTYLKNKKNFYQSLSSFSKIAAIINVFSWTYFLCSSLNPNKHYKVSIWQSKQAQIACSSAVLFYFLSQWLDVEQIALDSYVADLETDIIPT